MSFCTARVNRVVLTARPVTSGLPRLADIFRASRHFAILPEAGLGAGPPLPCFDLNPALPLLGITAQSRNCVHMTIRSWRLSVLPSTVKVQSPLCGLSFALSCRRRTGQVEAQDRARSGTPHPEHSRSRNEQARAKHPLRAPNVACRILFTSSPRRRISYTFVGSLGCRDRRAVAGSGAGGHQ